MVVDATSPAPRVEIGPFTIIGITSGFFGLDGGAMHGVVPRPLWQQVHPPDERNRIRLGLNVLLVRGPGVTAIVETGVGTHHGAKFADRFAISQPATLPELLAREGVAPEDVDLVINTHLHWDHAGGNVTRGEDGQLQPTFPRAEYVVQQADWEEATHPHERNRGSYRSEDFLTVQAAGQLRLVEGDVELTTGLRVERVGGHTIGMQIAIVEGGNTRLAFLTDLVPTSGHLDYPWIMGYDIYPVETLLAKKRVLPRAVAEDWVVAFVHDPHTIFGRVRFDSRSRVELVPL